MSQAAWLEEFEATIFSCEVAHVKPEPEVYLRLLDALGLSGSQVLFIDDISSNVEAALEVGLQAVQYDSLERLQQEVQARFGLPCPVQSARGNARRV